MKVRRFLLRVLALAILAGGLVRVFATQRTFVAFGIGDLWPAQTYSLYIYRVLGAFVVFAGIVLLLISRDPGKNPTLVRGCAVGFLIIGLVMTVAGLTLGLPPRHYLPDPVFSFAVAALLWVVGR